MLKTLIKKTSIFFLASVIVFGCGCGDKKLFATMMGMGSWTMEDIEKAVETFKVDKKCDPLIKAKEHLLEMHAKMKAEWNSMDTELKQMDKKDEATKITDHEAKMTDHKTKIEKLETWNKGIESLLAEYCPQK